MLLAIHGRRIYFVHRCKHSHSSRAIRRLLRMLRKNGCEVVMGCKEKHPGELLIDKFTRLIRSCDCVLVYARRNFNGSRNVQIELTVAASLKKRLICLVEENMIRKRWASPLQAEVSREQIIFDPRHPDSAARALLHYFKHLSIERRKSILTHCLLIGLSVLGAASAPNMLQPVVAPTAFGLYELIRRLYPSVD